MSTRGINFLDQRIANNVPETTKADVISIDELTHKLIADARSVGIKREEIDEEVDSLYRTILDAIVHFEHGLTEWPLPRRSRQGLYSFVAANPFNGDRNGKDTAGKAAFAG